MSAEGKRAFRGGEHAGGGVFFLLEERVEIFPQAGRGRGRGNGVEGRERLRERGELALALRAMAEMGARFGVLVGAGAWIEQLGKNVAGSLAVHGRRGWLRVES